MAGPGGGSRGGGFGGGSRGGGFGGGGFGGGHHRPPMYGGFGFGPRFFFGPRYYGGGCLSGLLGFLMAPIILLLLVGVVITSTIGTAVQNAANGGIISYDERVFQEYANEEYRKAFADSSAYEDNLLIVFLANEECDGYYCIAWVGDNIHHDINAMFGDEYTAFGQTMLQSINSEYYAYSLDSNLAQVMVTMKDRVGALGLKSSFVSSGNQSHMSDSKLVNYTNIELTPATVNNALENFTEETGIPVVIVVNTMENVFGKYLPMSTIVTLIVMLAIAVFAIYLIVKGVKNRKKNGGNGGGQSQSGRYQGGYGSRDYGG